MKRIILIATLALLAGCEPGAKQINFPVVPDELKDCKFFEVTDTNNFRITVARCPNSSTTVQMNNKARTTSVIVDGKEYVQK